MSEFWADGQPFAVIRAIESVYDTYPEQNAAFDDAIFALLEMANLDLPTEQRISLFWSLAGGRHDDVGGIVQRMIDVTPDTIESVVHSNQWIRINGVDAFAD